MCQGSNHSAFCRNCSTGQGQALLMGAKCPAAALLPEPASPAPCAHLLHVFVLSSPFVEDSAPEKHQSHPTSL